VSASKAYLTVLVSDVPVYAVGHDSKMHLIFPYDPVVNLGWSVAASSVARV
jgi:hypothetical protein